MPFTDLRAQVEFTSLYKNKKNFHTSNSKITTWLVYNNIYGLIPGIRTQNTHTHISINSRVNRFRDFGPRTWYTVQYCNNILQPIKYYLQCAVQFSFQDGFIYDKRERVYRIVMAPMAGDLCVPLKTDCDFLAAWRHVVRIIS